MNKEDLPLATRIGTHGYMLGRGAATKALQKQAGRQCEKGAYQPGESQHYRMEMIGAVADARSRLDLFFRGVIGGVNYFTTAGTAQNADERTTLEMLTELLDEDGNYQLTMMPKERPAVGAYVRERSGRTWEMLQKTDSWKTGTDEEVVLRMLEGSSCLRKSLLKQCLDSKKKMPGGLVGELTRENRRIAVSIMTHVSREALRSRPGIVETLIALRQRKVRSEYLESGERDAFAEFLNVDLSLMRDAVSSAVLHNEWGRRAKTGTLPAQRELHPRIPDEMYLSHIRMHNGTMTGIELRRRKGEGFDRVFTGTSDLKHMTSVCEDAESGWLIVDKDTPYVEAATVLPADVVAAMRGHVKEAQAGAMQRLAQYPAVLAQTANVRDIVIFEQGGATTLFCRPETGAALSGLLRFPEHVAAPEFMRLTNPEMTVGLREGKAPVRTDAAAIDPLPAEEEPMERDVFRAAVRGIIGKKLSYAAFEKVLRAMGCPSDKSAHGTSHTHWRNPDPAIDHYCIITDRYDSPTTQLDAGQVCVWFEQMHVNAAQQKYILEQLGKH